MTSRRHCQRACHEPKRRRDDARITKGSDKDYPSPSFPVATILSFTARIERAHSDRARSASKKDGWLFTSYLSSPVPLHGWLRAS